MALTLTGSAVNRGKELLVEKNASWLRIGIRGGGCSGLSYFMDYVAEPEATDKQFEQDGLNVCIDRKSYLFLNGTEIDWEHSLVKSGFVFKNPDAKKTCSCGESFSL
ncbi:MAG: iron-sulfur cluster assembly accessory protein [Alphaproteobacteria bacterium]|nr:iron-sulfur cluster assembly accessory protein [Alphaproteobacteria bacterium]